MKEIFVDSSGWIALSNARDGYHRQAVTAFKQLIGTPVRLITSDYVIDEAITAIGSRCGHAQAVHFGTQVRANPLVSWISVDNALWLAAWDIFVRYDDKIFSFTDCTSFAIMRQRTLREAFTFDRDFAQMGFRVWPDSVGRSSK